MYQKALFLLLLVACGIFCSEAVFAQNSRIVDSLKRELANVKPANKFDVLWGIAYELFDVDNPQALIYAEKAYKFAKTDNDSLHIVKSGRIYGQILRRVDRLDESIQILLSVLPISKEGNFEKETKMILNSLAVAHTFKAEYDKALEYHFQSLVIREKEGDKKEISIALNNIGLVYYRLGNFELSLDYYLQSLKQKQEGNVAFDLDRLLINIGLCYNWLSDYKNAREYFDQALKTCQSDCDPQLVLAGKFGLGFSSFGLKDYSDAEKYYKESLDLAFKTNDSRFMIENMTELARMYLVLNDLKLANDYLRKVDELRDNNTYKENLLTIYELNANYYTRTKDFEKANLFQKRYSSLKDSIYSDGVIKNLNKVQTQFAQRENLAIIAAQDHVLSLTNEAIAQQRILNWLLIAVISLTSALGLVIFLNYKRAKTTSQALDSAKQQIERQNMLLDGQVKEKTKELISTNEALIKVNDELDNFIYKTSHDIRGPLASLKGMVNLAIMDVKDDKALSYLGKLDLTAEKLNTVLTRLLIVNRINHAELKPEIIEFEAIIQEILTLEMKKGVPSKIRIDYEVAPEVRLISDREMVRLIMENLIDNAIKFYNVSETVQSYVNISIVSVDGHVRAKIKDNGTGIARVNRENIFQMFVRASERSETGGIGLYLAKLATEKLGGEINLLSSTDEFTEFDVMFPDNLHDILERRREEKARLEKERQLVHTKRVHQSV